MIINGKALFVCANSKEKKDGSKFFTCTMMSNNETLSLGLNESCYNYLLDNKVTMGKEINVAFDLGMFEGHQTYRIVGVSV